MTIQRSRACCFVTFVTTALVLGAVTVMDAQHKKTDAEAIEALVYEFTRFEDSGDMIAQARLMTPDRWWHGLGGRRTDNALYMKVQEEGFAASRKRYPGLQMIREVRDLKVRLIAPTVAVSSFTWFANRIIPPDLPAEKVSLVWIRQPEGWKIVNTHTSPLYLR